MRKIKVTCDSTCDLTKDLYDNFQIDVISLGVSLGDDFRRDGVNVTTQELFSYVDKTGELPKTSAISVGDYLDFFTSFTEAGCHVLHISLSSELSSSYQNACIAANTVHNVTVIDSRSLSSGSGHLAIRAAELAEAGLSAEEITADLECAKQRLDVSFVLQTLDYLHKGGRCSGVAAFGANLLKLRPEIEVVDGKMCVGRKYRGNAEKSISQYIRGRLEGRTDIQDGLVFVTHSDTPQEIVDMAIALVKELQPSAKVIETQAGSTIASHCGPCCLGVLFVRQ